MDGGIREKQDTFLYGLFLYHRHEVLLALSSSIAPSGTRGTLGKAGDQTSVGLVQDKHYSLYYRPGPYNKIFCYWFRGLGNMRLKLRSGIRLNLEAREGGRKGNEKG